MDDISPDLNFRYAAVVSNRTFSIQRYLRSFNDRRVVFSAPNDRMY